jgi:20S proteasome subunit beta 2
VTKTGTTISAVVFKDGVVLGADTRSTGGSIVANKNCGKQCCGFGSSILSEAGSGLGYGFGSRILMTNKFKKIHLKKS